jgi:CRP-like cAMP-binding protein
MIEVGIFPLADILPGRAFFKKGDYFSHFYFLEEGRASVTISHVSIEVSAPIFLGDYEISAELDQRTSTIKAITRCRIRTLPEELYPRVNLHHEHINAAFRKYSLKTRLLSYWLRKLFIVGDYTRN